MINDCTAGSNAAPARACAACALCERTTVLDSYLCENCRLDTGDRLKQLPVMYDELTLMLFRTRQRPADDGPRARTVEPPTPNLAGLDLRAQFAVLPSWRNALLDAMRRPGPAVTGDLGARVVDAAGVLREHLGWVAAEWPAAGDFAAEIRDLFNDVRTVAGEPELAARMGPCPQVVDGRPCGAPLLLPDRESVVRCQWCGATYPPGVWLALRRAQDELAAPARSDAA
ncbi:hypothetical protein [Streptomyces sp. NRRL F-5123]|uniref:hypothetical protein n=1 Tax=Streptomyces sp. NRRL F-5123 TaxID=1463856 RepID=UPI00069462C5|nr:hypothetical protein [Streptomyces sp. NRRL F-5123]